MARPDYEVLAGSDTSEREFLITDRLGRPITNDNGEEILGAPVDIHSITKRELGSMFYGTKIGIGVMQLMHPEIGAAVDHTGKFWQNPYKRVAVSMDPIMAVVYAKDPRAAGARVRDFHRNIHGTDSKGRHFNALSKDAFYWAHDTFAYGVENGAEHYSLRPFADTDREQTHLESNTWYSYYSMPMNMVPADYDAKIIYRQKMIDEVLEMTPAAERALSLAIDRTPPRPENVPKFVWPLAKAALLPVTEVMTTLTIGEMPVEIREKFNLPFSSDDQKRLDDIRNVVKTFGNAVPDPLKYLTVYDSMHRERGGKHKNWRDGLIHHVSTNAISLASSALDRASNIRSQFAA